MYTKITVLFSCCMIMHASLMGMSNNDFVLRKTEIHNVDYDTHRQLAVLNKACNKMVEDTYRPKKKLIEKSLRQEKPTITGHISWNRDFSRCAWINVSNLGYGLRNLQLTLVGLTDKSDIKKSSRSWETLYGPVFADNIRPFFDKEGRACFYNYDIGICEYSIGLNNDAACYRCSYEILTWGNIPHFDSCDIMFGLPSLLKAFLQSKQIRKAIGWGKLHNIEGVIIPEDYKTARENKSYDSLPVALKMAIEKRYEEQQREKKSGGD